MSNRESALNASWETARARPMAALSSSTSPYASTRGWHFETRRLYINEVSPKSPVLVTMLITMERELRSAQGSGAALHDALISLQTIDDRRSQLTPVGWRANLSALNGVGEEPRLDEHGGTRGVTQHREPRAVHAPVVYRYSLCKPFLPLVPEHHV